MKLRTDIERAEFIIRIPFVRDFEIKSKTGVKCIEKAVRYREEGNRLFQSDQCTQVPHTIAARWTAARLAAKSYDLVTRLQ